MTIHRRILLSKAELLNRFDETQKLRYLQKYEVGTFRGPLKSGFLIVYQIPSLKVIMIFGIKNLKYHTSINK